MDHPSRAALAAIVLVITSRQTAGQGSAPRAAQTASATTSRFVLDADRARDTISRHIYGQFAEHLGRLVYDGVWNRASPSDAWRLRDDVVDALRKIQVPNIRWPGGCFTDY